MGQLLLIKRCNRGGPNLGKFLWLVFCSLTASSWPLKPTFSAEILPSNFTMWGKNCVDKSPGSISSIAAMILRAAHTPGRDVLGDKVSVDVATTDKLSLMAWLTLSCTVYRQTPLERILTCSQIWVKNKDWKRSLRSWLFWTWRGWLSWNRRQVCQLLQAWDAEVDLCICTFVLSLWRW